jgi:hypothetical protein
MTAVTDEAVGTSDFDQMVELLTHEIAVHVWPDRCFDPEFVHSLRLSVRDNVRAMLATVEGTLDLVEANPQGAFAFAELSAELGIPVSELENAYWVGARGIWREWFARARSVDGRSADEQLDHVGRGTMSIFDYVIHILGAVVARYDVTRAEILRNREDRRREVLAQILDGSITQPTTEAESALGYRLRGTHVALTLKVDERAQAERAAAALAEAAGADSSMLVLHAPGTWMLWLGFLAPLGDRQVTGLASAAAAAGSPTSGLSCSCCTTNRPPARSSRTNSASSRTTTNARTGPARPCWPGWRPDPRPTRRRSSACTRTRCDCASDTPSRSSGIDCPTDGRRSPWRSDYGNCCARSPDRAPASVDDDGRCD